MIMKALPNGAPVPGKLPNPEQLRIRAFTGEPSRKVKVHFVKMKGHSNDKYNDMADQLAKKALGIL